MLLMLVTFMVHEVTWLLTNVFYLVLDSRNWLQKYRITQSRIGLELQYGVLRQLLVIHLLILLPLQILAAPILLSFLKPGWPSLFTGIWQFIAFNLIEDTIFYWIHRLLHLPWFFKHIHVKHHQFDAAYGHTFSLNGEYAHWMENLFNDLLPLLSGPWLCRPVSIELFWLWIIFRQIRSADAHSGYVFPWHPLRSLRLIYQGPVGHLHHHTLGGRRHNFGSYKFWDYLMGTLNRG